MKAKPFIFSTLCLLQAGDILSTRLALLHGAVEVNPVVRAAGLWQAKLVAFILISLWIWRSTRPRPLWVATAVYGGIVGWNSCLAAMH
ncbi:MAG: hypothetical protein ABSD98_06965 [Candidatus Korobacteraceae bacterium]|jgi:uncharacterized protein DUF5658